MIATSHEHRQEITVIRPKQGTEAYNYVPNRNLTPVGASVV